jgi:hypothetical protein
VLDHAQGVARPLVARDERHQISLDPVRIVLRAQAEALVHALHVGIDGEARDPERDAQHQVGGLAGDTAQGHQLLQAARHLALEVFHDVARGRLDRTGLLSEETGAAHQPLDLLRIGVGQGCGAAVVEEQLRRHLIHLLVGALCGEDRGNQQLEGRVESQGASRVGIGALKPPHDPQRPLLARGLGLLRHAHTSGRDCR